MIVRFVVCIDIEAESLEAAYHTMRDDIFNKGNAYGYETSDEFYMEDEKGDPATLQAAIEKVLDSEENK